MRALAVAVLALLAACQSTAPYTVPAALINTALAVGVSAQERAAGGCYATCAHGTVCNARTGLCDPAPCSGGCQSWETCVETEAAWRCVPATTIMARTPPASAAIPGEVAPGIGVSPATGSVPTLPPARATPEAR